MLLDYYQYNYPLHPTRPKPPWPLLPPLVISCWSEAKIIYTSQSKQSDEVHSKIAIKYFRQSSINTTKETKDCGQVLDFKGSEELHWSNDWFRCHGSKWFHPTTLLLFDISNGFFFFSFWYIIQMERLLTAAGQERRLRRVKSFTLPAFLWERPPLVTYWMNGLDWLIDFITRHNGGPCQEIYVCVSWSEGAVSWLLIPFGAVKLQNATCKSLNSLQILSFDSHAQRQNRASCQLQFSFEHSTARPDPLRLWHRKILS